MQVCQHLNRWPFPNPPETMTKAQLLFYDEALRQLGELLKDSGSPAGGHKPRKLRGEAKDTLFDKAGK